jgi:hypothetical protein
MTATILRTWNSRRQQGNGQEEQHMRTPIAIMLAAGLIMTAAPASAQETGSANAANAAESAPVTDANLSAVPPADANMAVTTTDVAPVATAQEPYAAPRARREKGIPWGLLGLLGLVGLLGRRRSD